MLVDLGRCLWKLLQMNEVCMALLSQLVQALAAVEELDPVTVRFYARSLREAGLVSQRGRGRGAAQMTASDAANLIIGVNASALAIDVGKVTPKYRAVKLRWTDAWKLKTKRLRSLIASDLTFGEHLEYLVDLARPTAYGTSALNDLLDGLVRKSDVAFADRRGIPFPRPKLEIEFARPHVAVGLQLHAPRIFEQTGDVDLSLIAAAVFRPEKSTVNTKETERRELTMITNRTLFEVARCLNE
jgi:hypothetical protein